MELSPPENVSYPYLRAIVGVQPKASKVPPLLSEFSHVVSLAISPTDLPVSPGQQLTTAWRGVPAGSRLLKKPPLRLKGGTTTEPTKLEAATEALYSLPTACNSKVDTSTESTVLETGAQAPCSLPTILPGEAAERPCDDNDRPTAFFGVCRSCDQFVRDAVRAGHPVERATSLPGVLMESVEFISSNSMFSVAKHRHAVLASWLERGKALSADEASFHSSLHPSVRSILAPKRLLWKEVMEFYGYPDCAVFD